MRWTGKGLSSGRTVFVVNLSGKHDRLERAGKSKMFPHRACYVLYRYNQPVTTFETGPAQEKKIKAGRGKIAITEKMIWRASEGL